MHVYMKVLKCETKRHRSKPLNLRYKNTVVGNDFQIKIVHHGRNSGRNEYLYKMVGQLVCCGRLDDSPFPR